MGKRGILRVLTIVLALASLCLSAAATHSSTTTLDPMTLMESLSSNFTLSVENSFFSQASIYDVFINTGGVDIISLITPTDWTSALNSGNIHYSTQNGAISSWGLQRYGFELKAKNVNQNTTYSWNITTKDDDNQTSDSIVQLTVLNDDTPPVLSNPIPADGMFVRQGTSSQAANITAVDPETGIAQVNFNYDNCMYLNNTISIVLLDNLDDFYNTVDLSSYLDSTRICFSFNAINRGDGMSNYSGILTIDGLPPTVTLVAPSDGKLMNSQSDFQFIASDNLAPHMSCELLVDGNVESTVDALNNQTTSISVANASEGLHQWAVRCADLVGLNSTSATRTYVLDRTPPQIRVNSPPTEIIAEGTPINIGITDNFELDGVMYTYEDTVTPLTTTEIINKSSYISLNETQIIMHTTGWPEGLHVITVNADDAAGNNATQTMAFIIDKTPPNVTLISPVDTSDVNANFTFSATDNYDTFMDCTLYVDDAAAATASVNTTISSIASIRHGLYPGNYTWRVECIDDAANNGVSDTWSLEVLDTSGPQIEFLDINPTFRGNDISIAANITDFSGVNPATLSATVTDTTGMELPITLAKDAGSDIYRGTYPTTLMSPLGDYVVRVSASDYRDNPNNASALYLVTYAYVVTLDLNPAVVETSQQVIASGVVRYDNGSLVPENTISLALPEAIVDAALNSSSGAFEHIFAAPVAAGAYNVIAAITAGNGFNFSDIEALQVNAPYIPPNGGGGGGGGHSHNPPSGGGGGVCPTNKCLVDGKCVDCTSDKEKPKDAEPVQSPEPQPEELTSGILEETPETTNSECAKDSDCGKGKQCNNGKCVGQNRGIIGSATGFLNIESFSSSLLWILLTLLAVAFILAYFYNNRGPSIKSKGDYLRIDRYMEMRNRKP